MRVWLARVNRSLIPACRDSERMLARMEEGEVAPFRAVRTRDPVAHRRYWALMTICCDNCERIEIEPRIFMAVKTKDDVHTAMKVCTGHFTSIFDADNRPVLRIPKSTNFDDMTADEWAEYWQRVLDVVHEKILPGVQLLEVKREVQKFLGMRPDEQENAA